MDGANYNEFVGKMVVVKIYGRGAQDEVTAKVIGWGWEGAMNAFMFAVKLSDGTVERVALQNIKKVFE